MRIIVEFFLFVSYLTVSNAQSGEIGSRVDNYWQRRINMELSQDRYPSHSFESPASQLSRRNEYDLPPAELPAPPSVEKPPFPQFPQFEQPAFQPFQQFPPAPFQQPPPAPFEQSPAPPFEQPPAPVFEQSSLLDELQTPHLDMPTQPADVNRRQNIYDSPFHLSRRQENMPPSQPYGLNRRHNMAPNYGSGMSSGREMIEHRHYPSTQYPLNGNCNRLSSPINHPVYSPVLSPCEMLCGTQKNGYQTPMFPQHATGSTHGMNPMGMAVA